jgi:hypothetical protein
MFIYVLKLCNEINKGSSENVEFYNKGNILSKVNMHPNFETC